MKSFSLKRKIQLALLIPLIISIIAIVQLQLFNINSFVTSEIKDALRGQVEIIYEPMVDKYTLHKIGVIKDFNLAYSEAQKIVKNTRFGENKKNYFWLLNAKENKILAYPIKEFEGKSIDSFKDVNNDIIFNEAVKKVRGGKEQGFFYYTGVNAHNHNETVNKVAYYMYFKEWDWILGTELNLSSIQSKTWSIVSQLAIYFCVAIIFIFILVTWIINKAAITPLINSVTKLTSSSNKMSSTADQLSSSSASMSQTTANQASSIEETSASIEEIAGMVENNVNNTNETVKISDEMKENSQQGSQSMEQLQVSMKEILESNEKIEELVKLIGNIGEKTQIMDEIVFQTKLLSFNASVEAERAGEHGRGFAVVAQEVGNLAEMSGKAAQEISEIVKGSIKEADTITTENRSKVEQGNSYVQEAAKVLNRIVDCSQDISEKTKMVQVASNEQSLGIQQINTAVTVLDKGIQDSSMTATKTASSAEELNAQAESLSAVISELRQVIGN